MGWVLLIVHLVLLFLITKQVIVLALALWTWQRSDIPYEATPATAIKKLIKKLEVKSGQKFYDLGSGGGGLAIHLALLTPAQVIAIEKNLVLHLTAKFKLFFVRNIPGSLTLKRQSFFETNLKDADYVYLYGVPELITRLTPKLIKELQTGATLISWRFPVNHSQFKLVDKFKDRHTMYLYQKT